MREQDPLNDGAAKLMRPRPEAQQRQTTQVEEQAESTEQALLTQRLQQQYGHDVVSGALSGEDTSAMGTLVLAEWALGSSGLDSLVDGPTGSTNAVFGILHSDEWAASSAATLSRHETSSQPGHAHLAADLIRRSRGTRLPTEVAARLSAALGTDISDAVIHTDSAAAQAAAAVNAHAFATGRDVFFGAGKYKPGSREGDELLAHELTHVVQDAEGRIPQASGEGLTVSSPSDSHEREAEAAGREAMDVLHGAGDVELTGMEGPAGGETEALATTGPASLVSREAEEEASTSESEGDDLENSDKDFSEEEWNEFFQKAISAEFDPETATFVMCLNLYRASFYKAIWDTYFIHGTEGGGDIFDHLNTLKRGKPIEEIGGVLSRGIKKGVKGAHQTREGLSKAIEERRWDWVTLLQMQSETINSAMARLDEERDTFFGALADYANMNVNVLDQSIKFHAASTQLDTSLEYMKAFMDGLQKYAATGEVPEGGFEHFDESEHDQSSIGWEAHDLDRHDRFIGAALRPHFEAALGHFGVMVKAAAESAWALDTGAGIAEGACSWTKGCAKAILSVYLGMGGKNVIEKLGRKWALEIGETLAEQSGEVLAGRTTIGDALKYTGKEALVDLVVVVASEGASTLSKAALINQCSEFDQDISEYTAKQMFQFMVYDSSTKSLWKLAENPMKRKMEEYAHDEELTPDKADEIVAQALRSQAGKNLIKWAIENDAAIAAMFAGYAGVGSL